ncbi:MAG: hypothetical protein JO127_15735 [Caulobacteraceae bacterium]|nr:hypothetical protein [Caulobacteraceae bacterium]
MGLYFFDLVSRAERSEDEHGCEFESFEAAYLDAHQAVLEMSSDMLGRREDPMSHRLEIRDRDRRLLAELPFEEALQPSRPAFRDRFGELHARLSAMHRERMALGAEVAAGIRQARDTIEAIRATLRLLEGR